METDLLTPEEIEQVRHTIAWMDLNPGFDVKCAEVKFLAGLVTRVASKAKMNNEQCMRTIKLLRLILKEVL
jgi:hypothetical protein